MIGTVMKSVETLKPYITRQPGFHVEIEMTGIDDDTQICSLLLKD